MNIKDMTPREFGVPHQNWRPNQVDALQKVVNKLNSGGGSIFTELPTGSGKSAIPTALGKDIPVLVLVQTHGLLDQYEHVYGFDIVKGKQAYECVLPEKISAFKLSGKTPTAQDCHLTRMEQCSKANQCPYLLARNKALASKRMACTYSYAALSKQVQQRTGILVMDECHNASEELLKNSTIEFTSVELMEQDVVSFPYTQFGKDGKGDILDKDAKDAVIKWCGNVMEKYGEQSNLFGDDDESDSKLSKRVVKLLDMIFEGEELFLFVGHPDGEEMNLWELMDGRSKRSPERIIFKPISVHRTIRKLVSKKEMSILMSATIGNPIHLANELGINNYESMSYPHPIPDIKRPVYDLHAEKMTWEMLKRIPQLYTIQANLISRFINSLDSSWRGIVLTTSYARISKLREILSQKLGDRIMIPREKTSVTQRISDFISDTTPGLIAVDTIQGWGAGIDLRGNIARFSVVAGVPYSNPSDRYEQLRSERPGGKAYSFYRAYNSIVQASGRVSRGEIENDGSFMLNVSAIADGSALTPVALSSYPSWYRSSIVR